MASRRWTPTATWSPATARTPPPGVREQVAKGLNGLGITLGRLDRGPEEVDAYRDLVTRYGEDTTPGVREQVAKGLINLHYGEGIVARRTRACRKGG
ncbi:MAG: hypothetical protein ACSLE3_15310 [Microbacteriaceae bacterium]